MGQPGQVTDLARAGSLYLWRRTLVLRASTLDGTAAVSQPSAGEDSGAARQTSANLERVVPSLQGTCACAPGRRRGKPPLRDMGTAPARSVTSPGLGPPLAVSHLSRATRRSQGRLRAGALQSPEDAVTRLCRSQSSVAASDRPDQTVRIALRARLVLVAQDFSPASINSRRDSGRLEPSAREDSGCGRATNEHEL